MNTELWIPQGPSSEGFVLKSIQQAPDAVAVRTLPEPPFFWAVFPARPDPGVAMLLCLLEPAFGAVNPSQAGRSLI